MSEASSKISWHYSVPKVICWLIGWGGPEPVFMTTLDDNNRKLLKENVANDNTY